MALKTNQTTEDGCCDNQDDDGFCIYVMVDTHLILTNEVFEIFGDSFTLD